MSMSEGTPWRDLIALLTNNATAIAAVVLCAENPNEYFEQHRDALGMRLIDTPDGLTPTIALIDALITTGELAYLDWKVDPENAVEELGALPHVLASNADLSELAALDVEVEAVAAAMNGLLEPSGFVVLLIDEDSDAYPFVVVPAERRSAILAAARRAGAAVRPPMAPAAGSAEVVEEVVASTAVLRDSRASEEHYQKKLEIFASGIGIMQHDLRGEFNAPIDAGGRTAVQLLRHSSDRLSAAYAVGTPIEDIIPLVRQAGQV